MQIMEVIPSPRQYPRVQTTKENSHGGIEHFHRDTRSAQEMSLQDNLYKRILKRDNDPNYIYKYIRVN